MQLFDKITPEARETIQWYVRNYADWNTHLDAAGIVKFWEQYKSQYLFRLFGEQLILSKEVTYKKDINELEDELDEALFWYESKGYKFVQAFKQLMAQGGIYQYHDYLDDLITLCALAENIYHGKSFSLPLPNGKELSVNEGCKVSRILGKIAAELNLPGYEEFRIAHSQVLNQKQLKGMLYLSIHPLDYMTMSDNDCGWSSCMSWMDEGEYRRGTVEMMNSPMVVVAYLANPKDNMNLNGFKWSNKKWRELFIINSDIITGVKGYPYQNSFLETIVCDWLRELAITNLGLEYYDKIVTYHNYRDFDFEDRTYNIRFYTDAMYNDFGSRSHLAYLNPNANNPKNMCFNYSGPSMCMHCGQETDNFDGESCMICGNCDDSRRCDECGDRYDRRDLYELDGCFYCEYCYNNMAITCDSCQNDHHCNDITEVCLARANPDGTHTIYTDIVANFCSDCLHKIVNNHLKSADCKIYEHNQGWRYCPYVLIDDCTEDTLKYIFKFDTVEEALNWQGFTNSFITVSDI